MFSSSNFNTHQSSKFLSLTVLLSICTISACSKDEDSSSATRITPVVVTQAIEEDITDEISLVGTLAADEMIDVQSEIDGIVEEIGFAEGEKVQKGALLFKIDQKKLSATLAESKANYKLAAANLKRADELLKNKTISSKEYDQSLSSFQATKATVERAKQNLEDASILAPFDGEMGARNISPGQLVGKGQSLSSLVKIDTIKAEFFAPERYVNRLVSGLQVKVRVDGYPDEVFQGEVFFVSPHVDINTRSVFIKAKIANQDSRLKPGMLAKINAVLDVRHNAITIPESALMPQKDKVMVYIVENSDTIAIRKITLGQRLVGKVVVTENLHVGELVVTEGTQKVMPGSKVSYAPLDSSKNISRGDS